MFKILFDLYSNTYTDNQVVYTLHHTDCTQYHGRGKPLWDYQECRHKGRLRSPAKPAAPSSASSCLGCRSTRTTADGFRQIPNTASINYVGYLYEYTMPCTVPSILCSKIFLPISKWCWCRRTSFRFRICWSSTSKPSFMIQNCGHVPSRILR